MVKFYQSENQVPLEMHKVRVVQKLTLLPVEERLKKIQEAGNNTFLLQNKDIYMDMLTDSGVNAMSDRQTAAMHIADDSYAGSETFNRFKVAIKEVFGTDHVLPAHQGRACENILAEAFVKPGMVAIMNFHFTTTKAHVTRCGGEVLELVDKKGLLPQSDDPFKGDFDLEALKKTIEEYGPEKVAYVRIEAGTNLIGGQPVSLANMLAVADICHDYGVLSVLDASLLQDNVYFMKTREAQCKYMSTKEIYHLLADKVDLIYFSARKLGFARGGAITSHNSELIKRPGRPSQLLRDSTQFASQPVPGSRCGCSTLHCWRYSRYGAWYGERAARARWHRTLCRTGAPASGHASSRVHPQPGEVLCRPCKMDVGQP